jgi:hypothetical protein
MNINFLYVWFGVMIVFLVAAPLIRRNQRRSALQGQDFVIVGFAVGGVIALTRVIIKVISDEKLQTTIDWDGTVAICIGCGFGIYLSIKEVIKLF